MKTTLWVLGGIIALALLSGAAYLIVQRQGLNTNQGITSDKIQQNDQGEPTSSEITAPELTYEGGYNGVLYLTGEKLGSEAPFDDYFANTRRNGVATSIVYFAIEDSGDAKAIKKQLTQYPGQIVPFYSLGIGGKSEADMLGDELTAEYKDALQGANASLGSGVMKGLGEIEMQQWPVPPTDPKGLQLLDFASQNKLAVMFHMKIGQKDTVNQMLKKYPNTTFLVHLFHNDFRVERQNIISLMQDNPNLNYTIDADHLMFDNAAKIGLLYKYQDESAKSGATKFIADFDTQHTAMLAAAYDLYSPLVTQFPDRITLGTEMSSDYTYQADAYDRIVKHLRLFAGKFDTTIQEKLAYQNAERLFGKGVTLP